MELKTESLSILQNWYALVNVKIQRGRLKVGGTWYCRHGSCAVDSTNRPIAGVSAPSMQSVTVLL